MLSGGLPKDPLRVARTISTINSGGSAAGPELADIVGEVITDELSALTHRAIAHAVSLQIPAAPDLLKLLNHNYRPMSHTPKPGRSTTQPVDIKKAIEDLSQLWAEEKGQQFADSTGEISPRTAEVCDGFLAGLYFLLTVQQLFTARLRLIAQLAASEVGNGTCTLNDDGVLRGLAEARAALDVNPYLAAARISDTRKDLRNEPGRDGPFADIKPAFLRSSLALRTWPVPDRAAGTKPVSATGHRAR